MRSLNVGKTDKAENCRQVKDKNRVVDQKIRVVPKSRPGIINK